MMRAAAWAWRKAARFLARSSPRQEGAAKELSPQVLAYLGDAVFEVYIRTGLVERKGSRSVSELHLLATSWARARGQAALLQKILPLLTEEEARLVRRGRNRGGRVPRGAAVVDYRQATGLETLLGALYLEGKLDRLQDIMAALLEEL